MRFAKWTFTLAGIYGLLVLTPLYFLEGMAAGAAPLTHPEFYYGFIGVALAFQVLFLFIGRDPARLRLAIIPSILEKLSFGAAVWLLVLAGRTGIEAVLFPTIDLALAAMFTAAWFTTRPESGVSR